MANLRDVRTRISSVKSTRQVTSAMKMVSASKLRKAQSNIENLRYYVDHLKDILKDFSETTQIIRNNKYTANREGNKVLLIVYTSNKGLCGTYNINVLKKATTYINWLKEQNFEIYLYIIGKKAHDFFKDKEFDILYTDQEINQKVTYDRAIEFVKQLKNNYTDGEFVRIDAVYNRFQNVVVQEPVTEKILPVDVSQNSNETDLNNIGNNYQKDHLKHILEPTPDDIANFIIPNFIDMKVYRILLDSYAGEQGARMTAMHQATENASELIKDLTLTYNKARQASITRELVEIVSGAEALK